MGNAVKAFEAALRQQASQRVGMDRGVSHLVEIAKDELSSLQGKLELLQRQVAKQQKAIDEFDELESVWRVFGKDPKGSRVEFSLRVNPRHISLSDRSPSTMYSRVFRISTPQELVRALEGYTDVSWDLEQDWRQDFRDPNY